ncbi:WD-40 repeat protein [Actinosynnema pretiosum subsp. pretiosum]|nr:WD-40 repeat protein [Actinosynnema pretiosum subsp. pretiosum]
MTSSRRHCPPDPITGKEGFGAALRRLRDLRTSPPSYRDLERDLERALKARGGKAQSISHRTIATWCTGSSVPSAKLEGAFMVLLRLLGVPDADIAPWLQAVRALRGRRSGGEGVPYPGLRSFGPEDTEYFFGRERLVRAVVEELGGIHRQGGGAVLLVGSSGAGKTSLLDAGVRTALARDVLLPGSASWTVVGFRAVQGPLAGLAHALAEEFGEDPDQTAAELGRDPAAVRRWTTRRARDGAPPRQLMVVVDQFEQALLGQDETGPDELSALLAALSALTAAPAGAVVVLSLRADQYGAAQNDLRVQELTGGRHVPVTPMNDDELREIIVGPARRSGVEPEPGLVELVLSEVSARTGRGGRATHNTAILPQLALALAKTWTAGRAGKAMTVEDYRSIGGLDKALSDTADQVWEALSPARREIARAVFLRLVVLHPGAADTRRRVDLGELSVRGEDADLYEVLHRFAGQGLLTLEAQSVEITHESLIFTWPRLRGWLDADRSGRLLAQQLEDDVRDWERHDRSPDLLYPAIRLAGVRRWGADHPDELSPTAHDFLARSARHVHRRTRRLQQSVALLTVLLVALGVLSATVIGQERDAARARDEATSRQLAGKSEALRDIDVSLARQLALAAYRTSPTVEARSALLDATALRPAIRMRAPGESSTTMYALAAHPTAPPGRRWQGHRRRTLGLGRSGPPPVARPAARRRLRPHLCPGLPSRRRHARCRLPRRAPAVMGPGRHRRPSRAHRARRPGRHRAQHRLQRRGHPGRHRDR